MVAIMHEVSDSKMNFVRALEEKYVQQEIYDDILSIPKDLAVTTVITLVGLGKISLLQRQLKNLVNIDLSNFGIDNAGPVNGLGDALSRVEILNLAKNNLDWANIVLILPYVPRLKDLIISSNQLSFNYSCHQEISKRKLQSLTMGRAHSSWTSIINTLSQIWTNIEQLDLWDCGLTCDSLRLENTESRMISFTKFIKVLRLSLNPLTTIDWIKNVGPLDSLIELDLSRCKIKTLMIDSVLSNKLCNLNQLNIAYNDIEDWACISSLHYLKSLEVLNCQGNPFFICEKFSKALTISRVGSLRWLNREEISRASRRDSEILYLRKVFPEYHSSTDISSSQHPRIPELIKLYGAPEIQVVKPDADRYLQVDLTMECKTISKKLPRDMRVAQLRMVCKKLFKLPQSCPVSVRCCDTSPQGEDMSYELDIDDQTLHFFSVKDGQKLIVERIG